MLNNLPKKVEFTEPQPYSLIYDKMKAYTQTRTADTPDLLWFLEHTPVYTQGQAGKAEHILSDTLPVIQTDRGGQVTYHGPGQLVVYLLIDLKRRALSLRHFIDHLQESVIKLLASYHITGALKPGFPGIYVTHKKIASMGLRVHRGCTYHGLSLNVDMDLTPFSHIRPCGISQLEMTQLSSFMPGISVKQVISDLFPLLVEIYP